MIQDHESSDKEQREKVLRRLKKILALTNSSSAGEAAAAMHQAQKLMAAHGLTQSDVEQSQVEEAGVDLTAVEAPLWESALISVVTRALGVQCLVQRELPTPGFRRAKARVVFVGIAGRAEIASYAFESLRRQLKNDMRNLEASMGSGGRKLRFSPAWRENYARGWCSTLGSKVTALVDDPKVKKIIETYIEDKTSGRLAKIKRASSDSRLDSSAANGLFMLGAFDGKKASIHRAMNADKNQQQLLSSD